MKNWGAKGGRGGQRESLVGKNAEPGFKGGRDKGKWGVLESASDRWIRKGGLFQSIDRKREGPEKEGQEGGNPNVGGGHRGPATRGGGEVQNLPV